MISRRVVNASPLIFLTRVGLLEVLQEPGVPVLVPDVVMAEISSLGPTDPAALAVANSSWILVVPTPAIPVALLPWGLDDGEAGVIAVALEERDSMAVLDDLAARQCAQAPEHPDARNSRFATCGQATRHDRGSSPASRTPAPDRNVRDRSINESGPRRGGRVESYPYLGSHRTSARHCKHGDSSPRAFIFRIPALNPESVPSAPRARAGWLPGRT